jgi:hypothetical protein
VICKLCGKAELVHGACPACLRDKQGRGVLELADPGRPFAARDVLTDAGRASVDRLAQEITAHGANTPTTKDTNPKDAVAVAHVKFSALPWRVLAGIALALSEGAWKYGRHNYRIAGVRASVYFDAALDHLLAWYEGEDIDPASGFHHIDKAIAGLFVLRDAMLSSMVTDDRPPAVPAGWIEKAHAETRELFERMQAAHGEPKAPFVRESERTILGVDLAVPGSERTVLAVVGPEGVESMTELAPLGGVARNWSEVSIPDMPATIPASEVKPIGHTVGSVSLYREPRPDEVPRRCIPPEARWIFFDLGGELGECEAYVDSDGDVGIYAGDSLCFVIFKQEDPWVGLRAEWATPALLEACRALARGDIGELY